MPVKDIGIRRANARLYHKEHREAIRKRKHEYYLENRERFLRRNKEWRRNNPAKNREYNRKYIDGYKVEVLTHYGHGKLACVVCGEKRKDCLSIDHINGKGNEHRKQLHLRSGQPFYRWLKRNNYPLGYQTLCMNCQFIKRMGLREHRKRKVI